MGFKVTRYVGEWVRIGEISIRVHKVHRNKTVELYIEAPQSVQIVIVKPGQQGERDREMEKP